MVETWNYACLTGSSSYFFENSKLKKSFFFVYWSLRQANSPIGKIGVTQSSPWSLVSCLSLAKRWNERNVLVLLLYQYMSGRERSWQFKAGKIVSIVEMKERKKTVADKGKEQKNNKVGVGRKIIDNWILFFYLQVKKRGKEAIGVKSDRWLLKCFFIDCEWREEAEI